MVGEQEHCLWSDNWGLWRFAWIRSDWSVEKRVVGTRYHAEKRDEQANSSK